MCDQFDGRWVRIEKTTFERLVVAAANHHARQARYCDTDFPEQVISDWLTDLERARVEPTPTVEPGDLLVKLKRAEFWTFTVGGWRELAPIELVERDVPEDAGLLGEHGAAHATSRQVPTDEPHAVAYETRFFGRSVVEDELERIRAGEPFEPLKGADLLRSHAEVLFAAVDVIRDRARRDGGPEGDAFGEDPWTLEGLLGLAYGYEHAARIIGS